MTPSDPSVEAATARYEAERAKRLRDDGLAQYESLDEHHLDSDFIQAGFGLNFVHFLSEVTAHITWLVDHCLAKGIASIEATSDAEDGWLNVLWEASGPLARYNRACTPSYGNSEGSRTMLAARNAVFPGSLLDYAEHLRRWRDTGTLQGTRTS